MPDKSLANQPKISRFSVAAFRLLVKLPIVSILGDTVSAITGLGDNVSPRSPLDVHDSPLHENVTTITLSGFIVVPLTDLQAVRGALQEHVTQTRAEGGCIVFDVTENSEQPGRFDVYEEFINKDAFAAHQNRVRSSRWGEISKNVTRHYTVNGLD